MSEPKLEWGPESEALFQNARRALSPPSAARERIRARVALKVGTAAAAAAVGTATTKAAAGTAGVSAATKGMTTALLLKIVAPVILVGAVAAATSGPELIGLRETSSPTARRTPESAPTGIPMKGASASAATSTPESPETQARTEPAATASTQALSRYAAGTGAVDTTPPKVARRAAPTEPAERTPVSTSGDGVASDRSATSDAESATTKAEPAKPEAARAAPSAEETALVGEIDRALRASDPARALRIAAEHEQAFPRGMLVEEREGARVIALCMTASASGASTVRGSAPDTPDSTRLASRFALREASAFLAAHPRSPMRARVLAACSTTRDGR